MIVRALDNNHDWTFGKSRNNYIKQNDAIRQNINTRLLSFLGNCFFDITAGLDWFNLCSSKNELALSLAISSVILNTQDVTGILQLDINLKNDRKFSVSYRVQTSYSVTGDAFQYDITENINF
jgi:hypothetical protein